MKKLFHVLAVVSALWIMTLQSPARAQEKIKVLSDARLGPPLTEIGEAFRRDSGHQVEFVFAISPVIHKKVTDGEAADVLIIQPNFAADLTKSAKVVSGEHPIIGRVGIGLFARADAPARDINTVEAFRQVLLNADTFFQHRCVWRPVCHGSRAPQNCRSGQGKGDSRSSWASRRRREDSSRQGQRHWSAPNPAD